MYPTLESMGITSFEDIEKFTLRYEGGFDVLKVYYRREKGSLLPKSKKFKFGRSTKTVLADGGQQTYRQVQEPSLVVLRAVEELGQIVGKQHEDKATKEDLINELEHLEKVVSSKIAELKEKIAILAHDEYAALLKIQQSNVSKIMREKNEALQNVKKALA
jgi:predicted XRE-type DNA-binding protein